MLPLNSTKKSSKKTSKSKTINVISVSTIPSTNVSWWVSPHPWKLINFIKKLWSEDEKQKAYEDLNKGIIASYICDDNSSIIQIKWDLLLLHYDKKFVNILTPLGTIEFIPFPNVNNKKDDISKYLNKKQLTKYLTSNNISLSLCVKI